ncbi:dihydrofolate reductase family protein [Aeromicrobium sp.]|uniref:dihydrofolate reductase family protein n=1 Tax=Aeromicrobium sp. TaxID=1871063 RepID=UPI003C659179
MRSLVNSTFVSLDGVVNHMDKWHFDYVSDETDDLALQHLNDAEVMLMGRATYDSYASAWPSRDGKLADRLNEMPKYVASTTLTDPEWNNTTVLSGDLVTAVKQLKEQDGGDILQHGVGAVTKTLIAAGLVDVLHLWIHPVLAGAGGPDDTLLTQGLNVAFDTIGSQTLSNGLVVMSLKAKN